MAKNTGGFNFKNFINVMAFVSICCIGLALLIGKIGGGQLAGAFNQVAQILAYIITAIAAFYFVQSKRHWAYYLIWAIGVALIVVFMII